MAKEKKLHRFTNSRSFLPLEIKKQLLKDLEHPTTRGFSLSQLINHRPDLYKDNYKVSIRKFITRLRKKKAEHPGRYWELVVNLKNLEEEEQEEEKAPNEDSPRSTLSDSTTESEGSSDFFPRGKKGKIDSTTESEGSSDFFPRGKKGKIMSSRKKMKTNISSIASPSPVKKLVFDDDEIEDEGNSSSANFSVKRHKCIALLLLKILLFAPIS